MQSNATKKTIDLARATGSYEEDVIVWRGGDCYYRAIGCRNGTITPSDPQINLQPTR
jgi:hypothetical protein